MHSNLHLFLLWGAPPLELCSLHCDWRLLALIPSLLTVSQLTSWEKPFFFFCKNPVTRTGEVIRVMMPQSVAAAAELLGLIPGGTEARSRSIGRTRPSGSNWRYHRQRWRNVSNCFITLNDLKRWCVCVCVCYCQHVHIQACNIYILGKFSTGKYELKVWKIYYSFHTYSFLFNSKQ